MITIAHYIDHTLLKPQATATDIVQLCEEAKHYGFYAVCVNGCYAAIAKRELRGSQVKLAVVVGFPLGAQTTEVKCFEAADAVRHGADEIDMVMNIGWFKAEAYDEVEAEIKTLKETIGKKVLKVIIETGLLNDLEIKRACRIVMNAGVDYVKTSTGFNGEGANLAKVRIMKMIIDDKLKLKASGGISNLQTAKLFIHNGVDRIGTSSGVAIVRGEDFPNVAY